MANITITDEAVKKTREFMLEVDEDVKKEDLYLRIAVVGGGCSGMSYNMAFEESPDEEDDVIESKGIKILIDKYSIRYLDNSEIDYVNNIMGSGYKINNPNITTSCSCGHSFGV